MLLNRTAILIVGLSVILFSGCGKKPAPQLPEVTVFEVKNEEFNEVWTIVGQAVSDPKVDLLARVSGFLEKCNFKQGAFVKKGELLFQIEKDQYEASVSRAKAEVAIKEAILKNAEITYNRNKYLREKDSISQADMDKATADRDSAIGDRDAALAQLQQAQLNLSYTDIKAPFDGRIGLPKYNAGNMVGPDSGVLGTVVSLNPMRVEFSVNESVFLRGQQEALKKKITIGQLLSTLKINLILSNDTEYEENGKIYFWNNEVSSSTGTIIMRAEFNNPDYILIPGDYVKVQIESEEKQEGIIMPQVAIQTALGGEFVMVVDKDNIIRTKNIKLGYRFDTSVVVTEGLEPGERVVTQGIQRVSRGMKVNPVIDSMGTEPPSGNQKANSPDIKSKTTEKIIPPSKSAPEAEPKTEKTAVKN